MARLQQREPQRGRRSGDEENGRTKASVATNGIGCFWEYLFQVSPRSGCRTSLLSSSRSTRVGAGRAYLQLQTPLHVPNKFRILLQSPATQPHTHTHTYIDTICLHRDKYTIDLRTLHQLPAAAAAHIIIVKRVRKRRTEEVKCIDTDVQQRQTSPLKQREAVARRQMKK